MLAGAAVCAAVAVSPASAAPTPVITTKYTYRVELKGVQTTTWSYRHAGTGGCDSTQNGSGKQTVRFSGKPTIVHMYDGISPTFFTGDPAAGDSGTLKFKLRGTVNRSGSVSTQPLSPEAAEGCPDGVGGPPPTPDCGTKKLKGMVVTPQWEYKSTKMILNQEDAPSDPYKFCPNLGDSFPYLIRQDEKGNEIGQDLPPADLFEHGQNIIIARGSYKQQGEVESITKIRWELNFKRIKKEKLGN
jgi:hypothetical protein